MGIWQRVKSKVKEWLGGKSPKRSTPPTPRGGKHTTPVRNQTSPSGGYRTNRMDRGGRVRTSYEEERKKKERKVSDSFKATTRETKDITSSFKNDKSMANVMQQKPSVVERKAQIDANRENARKRLDSLKTTMPRHNEQKSGAKTSGYTSEERKQVRRELVKNNPKAAGAIGGMASGLSFGATDILGSVNEGNKYYKKHRNEKAEAIGEFAGSAVSFGGAGKAAEKYVAKKLATKGGQKAVAKIASNKLVRKSAEKAVSKAVKKGTIKAGTKALTEEIAKDKARRLISNVAENAIVDATAGAAYDFNKATARHKVGSKEWNKEMRENALMNVGATSIGVGLGNLRRNKTIINEAKKALNVKAGVTDIAYKNSAGRVMKGSRPAPRIGESIEDRIARIDAERLGKKADDVVETAEKRADDYKVGLKRKRKTDVRLPNEARAAEEALGEATENVARNADDYRVSLNRRRRGDVRLPNEGRNAEEAAENYRVSLNRRRRGDVRLPNERRTVEDIASEAEVRRPSEPESVVRNDIEPIGEVRNERTGERTEFRRGEEATEREQARNRRTADNRFTASQESFDRDFAEFERKVAENQRRAEEIKSRIRSASSDEERAALREELDSVNAEIGREYRKASMRYHPDRGGSDEWMGRFNDAYDSYKRGSYKSRGFSGATSSRRAKTNAGENFRSRYSERSYKSRTAEGGAGNGGGNTPPPRRGAAASNSGGFKRAKGKVVDSVEDMVNIRHERPSNRQKMREAGKTFRMSMVDSLAPFEDVEREVAKTTGKQVDHGATDFLRRSPAMATRSVGRKQLKFNGEEYGGKIIRNGIEIENGKSLKDIFKGMSPEDEKAFNAYLLIKHAPDRLREGKSVFENWELSDGRMLDDPEFVARFKENKKAAEELEKLIKRAKTAEERVSLQEELDALRETMAQDADETIARLSKVWDAEIDKLVREHPNVDFETRAQEIYQYTNNELQNRVDAGLLSQETVDDWMRRYPNYVPTGRDGFNEIHGGVSGNVAGATEQQAASGSERGIRSIRDQLESATSRNWNDMSLNYLFKKSFGDRIATQLAKEPDGGMKMVLDNTIGLTQSEGSGKYYANIFIDGKKHKVEIEKKFYDALDDYYKNGRLGNALLDTMNDSFGRVSSAWKNLITEWSPIFMVKNGMRDFPEAVINSKQTKEFIGSMGEAMNDMLNGGEWSTALKNSGISQSSFIDLDKAIRTGKDQKSKLAIMNEAVELYPRLCEYIATFKKAGVNSMEDLKRLPQEEQMALRLKAAANAADVTVNFGRSGSIGKAINRGVVPFFNPSIQGWSKFVRNVSSAEQGGYKSVLKLLLKATAIGTAPMVLNNVLYKDNPNYQMISARDKATNYIIAVPPYSKDTDIFIKIPRSRFAAVYGLPAVNVENENKMGFAEMIRTANDQVAPIDPFESTLFSPLIAVKNNKSWYGSPIVPGSLEDLPKPEQYDANTSNISRVIGKATENLPEPLQVSPKKLDYLLDAEFGVVADFALPAFTPSRQGGGKNPVVRGLYAAANVPKRAFTIDATSQNDMSSRFYDSLQKANTKSQSSHATEEDKEEYKRLSAYSTEISGLTKAIQYLQGSDRATKQEDIRGLQKARNLIIQNALDGKEAPTTAQKLDAVQKYVGTTYAIDNFGSSADQEAMKAYGLAKYGNLTDSAMAKKIDADKDFYKGVREVGKLGDKIKKQGVKGATTTLAKSVALASVNADDDMFGAYGATKKSRVETATKMDRARDYISNGGSEKEFIQLEKARKTLGKLSDFDRAKEEDKIDNQLGKGEITLAEYNQKKGEIEYNANISYVGLATSLAQANAPSRGYQLYDIKQKNVQKGINLAAMGYDARDYREMAKAVDADGNGYPSKKEVVAYVRNSDVEDKATLFDCLYYYQGRNPFGTPKKYSREKAAATGRANGIKAISDETGEVKVNVGDDSSKSSGYSGYRRGGGYRHYGRRGGGSKKVKISALKQSDFKATKQTYKDITASLKTNGSSSTSKSSKVKVEPPKVKFKKYEV